MAKKKAKQIGGKGSLAKRVLNIPYLITRLENGEYLRPLFAWFFRAIAIGIGLGLSYAVIGLIALMINQPSAGTILMGIAAILVCGALAAVIMGILWIRAQEIMTMSLGQSYPMLALLSVVTKVFAEFASVSMFFFGLVFALMFLLVIGLAVNNPIFSMLGVLAPLYLPYAVIGIFGGFLLLVAGYATREFLSLLIRIEVNTRKSGVARTLDA